MIFQEQRTHMTIRFRFLNIILYESGGRVSWKSRFSQSQGRKMQDKSHVYFGAREEGNIQIMKR